MATAMSQRVYGILGRKSTGLAIGHWTSHGAIFKSGTTIIVLNDMDLLPFIPSRQFRYKPSAKIDYAIRNARTQSTAIGGHFLTISFILENFQLVDLFIFLNIMFSQVFQIFLILNQFDRHIVKVRCRK